MKIKNIKYYRIGFSLVSPLSIGSGEDSHTDSDIVLDSCGRPVIPAASFAGVIRHYITDGEEKGFLKSFFGDIDGEDAIPSRIKFYDGVIASDTFVTVRDSVALENKVGIDGAKFDFEAVESDAEFVTLVQLEDADEFENDLILSAFSALDSGELRLGSKTSRGYGQIKIKSFELAEFDFPDDKEKWLAFDQYDMTDGRFYSKTDIPGRESRYVNIHLDLKQRGAVSIRSYTVKNADDIGSADYIQLSLNDGTPVIPGTSWAGAFRSRFSEFAGGELAKKLFGYVDTGRKSQKKSAVYFGESRITGGEEKVITRNSIDRFSAGTKDGALYTEKTCCGGKCTLDIGIRKDIEDLETAFGIMCAVICDLDRGYLSVGGLGSVGRGIFEAEKMTVDGNDVTDMLKKCDIAGMTGGIS